MPAANDNTAPKGYVPAVPEPAFVIIIEEEGWSMLLALPISAGVDTSPASAQA